jgi:hypothetical protein
MGIGEVFPGISEVRCLFEAGSCEALPSLRLEIDRFLELVVDASGVLVVTASFPTPPVVDLDAGEDIGLKGCRSAAFSSIAKR